LQRSYRCQAAIVSLTCVACLRASLCSDRIAARQRPYRGRVWLACVLSIWLNMCSVCGLLACLREMHDMPIARVPRPMMQIIQDPPYLLAKYGICAIWDFSHLLRHNIKCRMSYLARREHPSGPVSWPNTYLHKNSTCFHHVFATYWRPCVDLVVSNKIDVRCVLIRIVIHFEH
jgi:hypothetical protein